MRVCFFGFFLLVTFYTQWGHSMAFIRTKCSCWPLCYDCDTEQGVEAMGHIDDLGAELSRACSDALSNLRRK